MADRPQNRALADAFGDDSLEALLNAVDEVVDVPAEAARQERAARDARRAAQMGALQEQGRSARRLERGLGRIEDATKAGAMTAPFGTAGGPLGVAGAGLAGFGASLAAGLAGDAGEDVGYASAAGLPEDQRIARASAVGGGASAALILLTIASNWKQIPTLFQKLRAMSPTAAAEVAQAVGAKNVDDFIAMAAEGGKKGAKQIAAQVEKAAGSGALANLSDDTAAALTKASDGLIDAGKAADAVKKGSKLWTAAKAGAGIAAGSVPFIAYDALTRERKEAQPQQQQPQAPNFMAEQARKTENLYKAAEARQTPEEAKARYATLAALAAGPGEELKREAANWLAANFVETMTHNQNVDLMQQQFGFGNEYMDRVLNASREVGMDRPRLILPPGAYWPDSDMVTSAAAELGGAAWEPTPFEVE